MSGETDSAELQEQQQEDQPYEVVTYTVTIWRNGFTVDDDPFKSLDDPENAAFLEVTNINIFLSFSIMGLSLYLFHLDNIMFQVYARG